MTNRKKIVRVLASVLLIVLLWLVFAVIQGLYARKISHHEQFIPVHAQSVLEIKGEELIRSFLIDLLADEALDERFNDYLGSSEGGEEPQGIDYLSNCYIFTFEENEEEFTGILVNVLDESQFEKVFGKGKEIGFHAAVKNGVGIMIYRSEPSKSSEDLGEMAIKLIQKPSKFDLSVLNSTEKDAHVNYWAKEYVFNNEKRFKELHLSISTNGRELKMKGNANFQSTLSRRYPILEQNDLSIQTQFIPKAVNDWWTSNSQDFELNFPKLTYISGNYHYSEPSPIKELKVLPNFDGIYAFEDNFNIRIPLIALAATQKINSLNLKSFQIGEKKIYYQQIDPKTVYLGQTPYRATMSEKNALVEVKGDLKQLLEIRNGGMTERLLSLSPEYNATKRFLSNIEHSNFYVKENDDKKVDILAEITFEDGKSALNEMIVLLIDLGLFE